MQQHEENKNIGLRIEALRNSLNLSQDEFASLIGVPQRQGQILLSKIESGVLRKFYDSLWLIRRIANLTNVTINYIITGVSDMKVRDPFDYELVRDRLRIAIGKTNVPITEIAKITNTDAELLNNTLTQKIDFKLRYFLPIIVLYRININYVLGYETKIFDIDNNVLAEMLNISSL